MIWILLTKLPAFCLRFNVLESPAACLALVPTTCQLANAAPSTFPVLSLLFFFIVIIIIILRHFKVSHTRHA